MDPREEAVKLCMVLLRWRSSLTAIYPGLSSHLVLRILPSVHETCFLFGSLRQVGRGKDRERSSRSSSYTRGEDLLGIQGSSSSGRDNP